MVRRIFKYYLFGKSFTVITDHRVLLSKTKERRSNKSYNSRLTRWLDRLLPFDFNIEHIPGAKMGLVDYISRQPKELDYKKDYKRTHRSTYS